LLTETFLKKKNSPAWSPRQRFAPRPFGCPHSASYKQPGCFFVKTVCGIGGDDLAQFLSLLGTSLPISSTCLAISSWSTSTESASLTSVYLVGFQLPLSGVLLAMPEWMADLTRPFIASYWGWSGYLQSMADTPFLELASQASQPTPVGSLELSLWMLSLHTLAGLFFAWLGLKSARWNTT
jgi:hypothetical protein